MASQVLSSARIRFLKKGINPMDALHIHGYRHEWLPARKVISLILHHHITEVVITASIILSMVLVIAETDARAAGGELLTRWKITELILMIVFVLEISARLYVLRLEYFSSKSNCMDFVIVVLDIGMGLLKLFSVLESIPSIRFLRIFRILRLLRAVRIFTHFRELYLMIHGLLSAIKAVYWAALLVGIVILMWAILAVEILHPLNQKLTDEGHYRDCERCPRAYSSVWNASLTFIQQVVAGDAWGIVTVDLIEAYPVTSLLFLTSLATINLGIMNLVLMVIVDRAEEARNDDVESEIQAKKFAASEAKQYVYDLCKSLDDDHNGVISLEEFQQAYDNNQAFAQLLEFMGIMRDDLATLFDVVDQDRNGQVHYERLVDQFHKMKSEDTHMLIVFIRHYIIDVRAKVVEEIKLMKESLFDDRREDRIVERIAKLLRSEFSQDQSQFQGEGGHASQPTPVFRQAKSEGTVCAANDLSMKDADEAKAVRDTIAQPSALHFSVDGQNTNLPSLQGMVRELERMHDQIANEKLRLNAQSKLQQIESLVSVLDQDAHLIFSRGSAQQELSVAEHDIALPFTVTHASTSLQLPAESFAPGFTGPPCKEQPMQRKLSPEVSAQIDLDRVTAVIPQVSCPRASPNCSSSLWCFEKRTDARSTARLSL